MRLRTLFLCVSINFFRAFLLRLLIDALRFCNRPTASRFSERKVDTKGYNRVLLSDDNVCRFDVIRECDGQTDGRTPRQCVCRTVHTSHSAKVCTLRTLQSRSPKHRMHCVPTEQKSQKSVRTSNFVDCWHNVGFRHTGCLKPRLRHCKPILATRLVGLCGI